MDDKNSTPETSPARPADAEQTEVVAATPAPAPGGRADAGMPAAAPAPKRRRTRGLLIAGGAVLAAAVLAGGGIAVGAAIADEVDEDDTTSSVSGERDEDSRDDDSRDDSTGDDSTGDDSAGGDLSTLGTSSADDLVAMIDAASAAGEGEPVSIDLKRDGGAEVTLEAEGGAETEVRVDASGAASVTSTESADSDDTAPQNILDADAIAAIVDAALAEADGRVVEIEADDDSTSPWDVTVLTAAGEFVEIDLDAEFAVIAAGVESDD
ncbi:hypothetical protein [Microbacterium sp. LWS13-1.2]|uniref:PepSY domain-containing protein n=1 Tax=Microbacterium sp. LWS13-1.2 TaxID=3135264 RepID=A0AAU6SB37_9MICO